MVSSKILLDRSWHRLVDAEIVEQDTWLDPDATEAALAAAGALRAQAQVEYLTAWWALS